MDNWPRGHICCCCCSRRLQQMQQADEGRLVRQGDGGREEGRREGHCIGFRSGADYCFVQWSDSSIINPCVAGSSLADRGYLSSPPPPSPRCLGWRIRHATRTTSSKEVPSKSPGEAFVTEECALCCSFPQKPWAGGRHGKPKRGEPKRSPSQLRGAQESARARHWHWHWPTGQRCAGRPSQRPPPNATSTPIPPPSPIPPHSPMGRRRHPRATG